MLCILENNSGGDRVLRYCLFCYPPTPPWGVNTSTVYLKSVQDKSSVTSGGFTRGLSETLSRMASATATPRAKILVSLPSLAKMIDHSLIQPTMTDEDIEAGLMISRKYNVATACIKPYSIPQAQNILAGSDVKICAVIGFPHGNSTIAVKVHEATEAVNAGAQEVDMVVNVGKVLGGNWLYVEKEITWVNEAVIRGGLQSG